MKFSIFILSIFCFGLSVSSNAQSQGKDKAQIEARKAEKEADKVTKKGQNEANKEVKKGQKGADKEIRKGRNEENKKARRGQKQIDKAARKANRNEKVKPSERKEKESLDKSSSS
jgi:hypothetical protein